MPGENEMDISDEDVGKEEVEQNENKTSDEDIDFGIERSSSEEESECDDEG